MALEGAQELRAELSAIREGRPKSVYVVFGDENYLVRNAGEAIAAEIAKRSGAELVRVDASGRPPQFVLDPMLALSLFAPVRVPVVRNFSHLLAGDEADELLARLDAAVHPGSAVVFVAAAGERIDKRLKGYKGLAKRGAVLEFPVQKPDQLNIWLREKAREEKKVLSADAASFLLQRVGTDMETLRSELDKAILFCLGKDGIELADLEPLVGKSREDQVWDVGEAVAARDASKAVELIRDLVASGTHPLVVLTLLVRQARHLLQARLLWESAGCPSFSDMRGFQSRVLPALAANAFGGGADDVTTIHPFATFKRFEIARHRSTAELRSVLARLCIADRDSKTGVAAGAREVIEELVLELCARAEEKAA
jgi:DNA polymerase-3 subunit delta